LQDRQLGILIANGRAKDSQATHHAGSREHGVAHRVGSYMAIATDEVDLDDDEVVDMFEIRPDALFGMPGIASSDDDITGRADTNSAGNMARQDELPVAPLNVNLNPSQ
jgi:hypothetical protein